MRIPMDPEQVTRTFSGFADSPVVQESAQLFAQGLPVAEMIQAFAMNERVFKAFLGYANIYPGGALERGILEKVILLASRAHECQFCTESHLRIMDGLGIGTDLAASASQTERERLAVEYAGWVVRDANRIPDELFTRLRAVFTDSEIVELTFHTGFITLLNLFNNALGIRYRNEFDQVKVR